MRTNQYKQSLSSIEEDPQISQRTLDLVVLIERKLSSVESGLLKVK